MNIKWGKKKMSDKITKEEAIYNLKFIPFDEDKVQYLINFINQEPPLPQDVEEAFDELAIFYSMIAPNVSKLRTDATHMGKLAKLRTAFASMQNGIDMCNKQAKVQHEQDMTRIEELVESNKLLREQLDECYSKLPHKAVNQRGVR
jgi:hypothetical protein